MILLSGLYIYIADDVMHKISKQKKQKNQNKQ